MIDPDLFVNSLFRGKGFSSVPNGKVTLYGTCYGILTKHYLNSLSNLSQEVIDFLLGCQNPETGLFEGPEFSREYFEGKQHDAEHILLHLLCSVLPVLQQFDIKPKYSIKETHKFCDLTYLKQWLDKRDWKKAWLEGNNLLFIGQILIYLRNEEKVAGAQDAIDYWFRWLDREIDPTTGLWGTNGFCSSFHAMCGGYHQLLVYYYENHPVRYPERLVDTVLALQHPDGGFSPRGGGGACEDVDAVDILVNLYKLINYKRPQIRYALRRCLRHISSLQNEDGGFPYKRNAPQSHMGIPDTIALPNVSTMFATWFRVHTIALISEILTDEPSLSETSFNFNKALSMGWHNKWDKSQHHLTFSDKIEELPYLLNLGVINSRQKLINLFRNSKRKIKTKLLNIHK